MIGVKFRSTVCGVIDRNSIGSLNICNVAMMLRTEVSTSEVCTYGTLMDHAIRILDAPSTRALSKISAGTDCSAPYTTRMLKPRLLHTMMLPMDTQMRLPL